MNVLYFHGPDKSVPVEESLAALDEFYKAGAFSKFGLSNYFAEDVEKIYQHCKTHNYVLPTVYQGNYNPLGRRQETELLPTLRRLGISFYAYSPIAGGFLAKTKQQILEGAGRFTEGSFYSKLYANPKLIEALNAWNDIAQDAGTSPAELAYRWVAFNSALKAEHGDGIIVGASSIPQLKQSVEWLGSGPLDAATTSKIDAFWEQVKDVAILDNFNK